MSRTNQVWIWVVLVAGGVGVAALVLRQCDGVPPCPPGTMPDNVTEDDQKSCEGQVSDGSSIKPITESGYLRGVCVSKGHHVRSCKVILDCGSNGVESITTEGIKCHPPSNRPQRNVLDTPPRDLGERPRPEGAHSPRQSTFTECMMETDAPRVVHGQCDGPRFSAADTPSAEEQAACAQSTSTIFYGDTDPHATMLYWHVCINGRRSRDCRCSGHVVTSP